MFISFREITGNFPSRDKSSLRQLEAGKEETADFSISEDVPGEISASVITYEDANMLSANCGRLLPRPHRKCDMP
jgi:hypothetical protein